MSFDIVSEQTILSRMCGRSTWSKATNGCEIMMIIHDQRETHRRRVCPRITRRRPWPRPSRNCPNSWTFAFWWTTTVLTAPWRSPDRLGLQFFVHDQNYGYGRNQQTCYREALAAGADVVIMVHPDYQYTPLLVTAMASMVAYDVYDVVLGSRIIGGQALHGGMPFYKYVANRLLTAFENVFLGIKLSEYHTGYRAFSRKVLLELPLLENSDDFVFDNQVLAQCVNFGFRIGEVSCPTKYFKEASSINFRRSVTYGLGVVGTTLRFALQKWGLGTVPDFQPRRARRLDAASSAYYAAGAAEPPA